MHVATLSLLPSTVFVHSEFSIVIWCIIFPFLILCVALRVLIRRGPGRRAGGRPARARRSPAVHPRLLPRVRADRARVRPMFNEQRVLQTGLRLTNYGRDTCY